jgi:hypothetical protein
MINCVIYLIKSASRRKPGKDIIRNTIGLMIFNRELAIQKLANLCAAAQQI